MTLEGLPRLSVDANHDTIRIAGEVDADLYLNLSELFFNFLFFLRLALLDVRPKLSRYVGDFVEEREFPLEEFFVLAGEAANETVHNSVEGWFDGVGLCALVNEINIRPGWLTICESSSLYAFALIFQMI